MKDICYSDMIGKSQHYEFLATLNMALCLIGYPFAVCLLSIFIGGNDTTPFTWGYHSVSLLIAAITLFYLPHSDILWNNAARLTLIFFVLYTIRALYDFEIGYNDLSPEFAYKIWNKPIGQLKFQAYIYFFLLTIFRLFVCSKTLAYVNWSQLLSWLIYFGFVAVACGLYSALNFEINQVGEDRIQASKALNPISFGHFCATVSICALCKFLADHDLKHRIVSAGIFVFAGYVMLLAASRGPFIAWSATILFVLLAEWKVALVVPCLIILWVGNLEISSKALIDLVKPLSPGLAHRLTWWLIEEEGSRSELFSFYFNECQRHPFFGFQLDFLGYSHNAIIDAFMMFGMFAGLIVPVAFCYCAFLCVKSLKMPADKRWIFGVMLQVAVGAMSSGTLGTNIAFWSALVSSAWLMSQWKTESDHGLVEERPPRIDSLPLQE